LKNPKLKEEFQNFLEALHCKDIYSSLYGILFLYRRILTASCLVFMSENPALQIVAVLSMTLMTVWYIGCHTPFSERKKNLNEIFNEICVILCIYTIMVFNLTDQIERLNNMTLVFIIIVAFNILFFAIQLVPDLVLAPCRMCIKNKADKKNAEENQKKT
jgi:hypothetical protein